jgi:hypothetical protein
LERADSARREHTRTLGFMDDWHYQNRDEERRILRIVHTAQSGRMREHDFLRVRAHGAGPVSQAGAS